MPTGDTLATLIQETQYELGQSAASSVGINFREGLKDRIRREYRRLYHDFDWPDLRITADKTLAAGQRYYDWPAGLTLGTVDQIWVNWSNRWHELERGIAVSHYNALDSDKGIRADPVLRWQPHGQAQVEIWPTPAGVSTLRFVAKKAFAPLVNDADPCLLDTDLVVLHAAAGLAAKSGSNDAKLIQGKASAHYATLKGRMSKKAKPVNFSGDTSGDELLRPRLFVGVTASPT